MLARMLEFKNRGGGGEDYLTALGHGLFNGGHAPVPRPDAVVNLRGKGGSHLILQVEPSQVVGIGPVGGEGGAVVDKAHL